MLISRRRFCATAAFLATPSSRVCPQSSSRIDVIAVERDRVLAEAQLALTQKPFTLTSVAVTRAGVDSHDFFSESYVVASGSTPFRAHADALADASANIAALTTAYVITKEDRYALYAGKHLFAWFVDPITRINPAMPAIQTPAVLADLAPLAEIARALPFLADTAALCPPDLTVVKAWFAELQQWLDNARPALIAREAKDHNASAWLLLSTAIARLVANEAAFNEHRLRFKKHALRNQISAGGDFPHEVASPFPFRNTLLNFDLLAGACELLSTQFSSLWTYELDDGPGIRGVAAFLYPMLKEPVRWQYPADASNFREIPRRRPALLLAGRAYDRPEYVELWRSLAAPSRDMHLRTTFPIRQPLLWTARAPHGA